MGFRPRSADDVLSPRSADRASEEWKKAETLGIRILDILHPDYPSLLREIFDPPAILYIRGKRWDSDLPQVAIVGTRRPTGYGINCAERLAEDLARAGSCDHFGSGPRHRCGRAPRRAPRRGDVCGFRQRAGFRLPARKPKTRGKRGRKWRVSFGIPARHAAVAGELSDSKPDHCGHVAGCCRGGGRGILRLADHRAAGTRGQPRSFCRSRQHHVAEQFRTACADPAGSEARRRAGRTSSKSCRIPIREKMCCCP